MKSLVWLRNDLRIDDNPALRHACANSDEVHCIYIFSKEQMKIHNEANCKIEFLIDNLKSLSNSLKELNSLASRKASELTLNALTKHKNTLIA